MMVLTLVILDEFCFKKLLAFSKRANPFYFFQGDFVPISVAAEKTKYPINKPIPTKKGTRSFSILAAHN